MPTTAAAAPLVEHLAVKVLGLAAEVVKTETLIETPQTLAAERLPEIGVGAKPQHRLGELGHVAGGDKKPGLTVINDLGNATGDRPDNGLAQLVRFENFKAKYIW